MRKVINSKGQALIEYVLIVALISGVAIAAVMLLGGALKDKITESSCEIVGETFVKGDKRGEGHCVPKEE
ncbi:MAG: Flp family type IVb pilin [bacterium]|nr:Flp family type IVb pilin [bacterium]